MCRYIVTYTVKLSIVYWMPTYVHTLYVCNSVFNPLFGKAFTAFHHQVQTMHGYMWYVHNLHIRMYYVAKQYKSYCRENDWKFKIWLDSNFVAPLTVIVHRTTVQLVIFED